MDMYTNHRILDWEAKRRMAELHTMARTARADVVGYTEAETAAQTEAWYSWISQRIQDMFRSPQQSF
jgi:hypothetical protein